MMQVTSVNLEGGRGAFDALLGHLGLAPRRGPSTGDIFARDRENASVTGCSPALAMTPPPPSTKSATSPGAQGERFVAVMGRCMKDLAATAFEEGLNLTDAELEMLVWQQQSTLKNNACGIRDELSPLKMLAATPRRALTRLYCLDLLQRGDAMAYQCFTRAQDSDDRVSEKNFFLLSYCLQVWGKPVLDAVRASILIAKNDHLIQAAAKVSGISGESHADYEARVLREAPDCLPVYHELAEDSRRLLVESYLGENVSLQQMLPPHVANASFAALREKIEAGNLCVEIYKTWLARGLIDLIGSHGHIDHRGAIGLTESRLQAIFLLIDELNCLWRNTRYPSAINYRLSCAKKLHRQTSYVQNLAHMLQLEDPSELVFIDLWFESLNPSEKLRLSRQHDAESVFGNSLTTYQATMLRGLKAVKSTESAPRIGTVLETYHQILQRAEEADKRANQPHGFRCFREIAKPACLSRFGAAHRRNSAWPRLEVDPYGVYRLSDDTLNS